VLSESADVTLESLSSQAGWDDENFVEGSRLRGEGQVTVAPCSVSHCDHTGDPLVSEPVLSHCASKICSVAFVVRLSLLLALHRRMPLAWCTPSFCTSTRCACRSNRRCVLPAGVH